MIEIRVAARAEGGAVVAVSGDLDAFAVAALRHCVDGVLAAAEVPVLVDLAAVGVFGAAAIAECARLDRAASEAGSELRLLNPSPLVRRVLGATGHLYLIDDGEDVAAPASSAEPPLTAAAQG